MFLIRLKLHWQILIALGLSLLIGVCIQAGGWESTPFAGGVIAVSDFLGALFMNALKMIVVPLIVSTIVCGIMTLGSERDFGRLGGKTLLYYTASGLFAVLVGVLVVNLFAPGTVSPDTAKAILGQGRNPKEFMDQVQGTGASDLVGIFLRMVPPNIVSAAADNGQLLGLITFSLLFGFFVSKLPERLRAFQIDLWTSIQKVMMMITDLIIRFAPIGVLGLVTPVVIRTGTRLIEPIALFFVTVLIGLAIHFFVVLGLFLRTFGKVNPIRHYKAMAPVLLTAFSTASSSATLPVTLETVENDAGVSNRTASFTLPLGATVNMDGTALYECVVVLFIGQLYASLGGVHLSIASQISVVLLALVTSVGVAGIPSASLVAITVILGAVGLPLEAVGVVWVTDRILDMCRTSVNVFSDTVGAVIIARSEGETSVYGDAVIPAESAVETSGKR